MWPEKILLLNGPDRLKNYNEKNNNFCAVEFGLNISVWIFYPLH